MTTCRILIGCAYIAWEKGEHILQFLGWNATIVILAEHPEGFLRRSYQEKSKTQINF